MKKIIKVGSDFSGVGAFDFAIKRIAAKKNLEIKNIFACDMDKFARESYLANHDAPDDYPSNVYERDIPNCSLDIYMTSPPCQAFSIAGKRKGKDDERGRGILFFNSLEFIETNRPRFFIFENVKGLLSHDKPKDSSSEFGRTFQEWINHLGGKLINGLSNLFPEENSVPYHLYFKVLNTKEHGVPQNRERVFLIGIRDDEDNVFSWPNEEPTTKRLKDVLEENDSVNFAVPNSETRRGRVGKQCAQTLDTGCQQGVFNGDSIRRLTPRECFRLQDFPDSFKFVVSDSQLYKQAGNSITVRVLEKILDKLKL